MSYSRVFIWCIAALAIGCQGRKTEQSAATPNWREESPFRTEKPPMAPLNPPTLLSSGRLPLALFFDTGGTLRVVDATTRQVLVKTTAARGTLISVTTDSGVVVGRETLVRGPLSEDDIYEIWWDPQPPKTPPPRPATRP